MPPKKKKNNKKKKTNKSRKAIVTRVVHAGAPIPSVIKSIPKAGKTKRVTGFERKFSVPAAFGTVSQTGQPRINLGRPFVVSHTEYLEDIFTQTTTFTPTVYALQPGLTDDFPWLGQFGQLFEQYHFKRLQFIFKTRAASSQTGTMYMCTQLDSNDPDFTSKDEMINYAGCTNNVIWTSMTHDCLLNRGKYMPKLFTRNAPLSSGADPQLYDVGKFSWVCIGDNPSLFRGELWVSYEVAFYNPKITPLITAGYSGTFTGTGQIATPIFSSLTNISSWIPFGTWLSKNSTTSIVIQEVGAYVLNFSTHVIDLIGSAGIASIGTIDPSFTAYAAHYGAAAINAAGYLVFVTSKINTILNVGCTGTSLTDIAFNWVLSSVPFQSLLGLTPLLYSEEQRTSLMSVCPKNSMMREKISRTKIVEEKKEAKRSRTRSP